MKHKNTTKRDLSIEVEDLIGLDKFKGKGTQIVKIIFDTIKTALLSGEAVIIPKLGKFYVHNRPESRVPVNYMYGGVPGPRQLITLPPKRYVKFQPYEALLEMVNDAD